jgi:hypothetical protein
MAKERLMHTPIAPALHRRRLVAAASLAVAGPVAAQAPGAAAWDSVSRILQVPPAAAVGYRRFNFPRRDLAVRVDSVLVAPGLALTGWAGFAGAAESAMVMGDLVVIPAELGGVVAGLLARGFAVSAIHNHLAGERPAVLYVHFDGHGPATLLAARLDSVLAATGAPRTLTPPAPPPLSIDTALVFGALGIHGRAAGNVAGVSPVLVPVLSWGADSLLRTLAAASPVNIQDLGGGRAAASGDFAVTAERVQPLLRALSAAHIMPTAVHSHLVGERPTITYIHFWGTGPLPELLRGLRGALDAAR